MDHAGLLLYPPQGQSGGKYGEKTIGVAEHGDAVSEGYEAQS